MFVLSNLLIACAKIIEIILTMAYWLILIRALISWVNPDPFNPIVQFLYKMTEPILCPIRKLLPLTNKKRHKPVSILVIRLSVKNKLSNQLQIVLYKLMKNCINIL